jgi:hypothetical protein
VAYDIEKMRFFAILTAQPVGAPIQSNADLAHSFPQPQWRQWLTIKNSTESLPLVYDVMKGINGPINAIER